jgi:hypothetical protein
MGKPSRNIAQLPEMDDAQLEQFWDRHEPEDFDGWEEEGLTFQRPPKKLIQLRLELRDIRLIDKESKRTGIDRSQLVRAWVKEKIEQLSTA